ncbi:cupin domain-containing protein [Streptomyces sp. NBC_00525]|uniref:cupin domain-containing protein n=1 Tax=Streptomyces sp. NBC_00525 TaxID=2903660 RepID=UPI002E81A027|nr:cupin domain-containing protein [Streptomyces sp. NBC_00525]WUC94053.1 cupin domain-containing protein [Streptomyces sp. NBC_00525]
MLPGFTIASPRHWPEPDEAGEGITAWRIKEASVADPSVMVVLRFAGGAAFGEDRHGVREIVHVMEGEFGDGRDVWPAGTVICGEPGSVHHPQSATGCTLLVIYPDGEAA